MSGGYHYIFVILPKKRRKPNDRYDGIMKHYYFRIYYYSMLPDQNPIEVIRTRDPDIYFPVKNHDEILQFGYELGGSKVAERRSVLRAIKQRYKADVVGFVEAEKYHRHLAFALTASVLRSKTKIDLLKAELLTANQGLVMLMANLAEEFYKEYRGYPGWHNILLRTGRAIKILLGLDKRLLFEPTTQR